MQFKRLAWFLLCVGVTSFAMAQNDSISVHSNFAIGFTFSRLELGGGLAVKSWLDNNYALRPEINVNISKDDYDDHESNTLLVGATVAAERHFRIDNDISPYLSIASGYSVSVYKSSGLRYGIPFSTTSHYYSITFGIGAGVEYWITSHISLAGQHSLRIIHSWRKEEVIKTTDFDNQASSLLLSIYL